MVTFTISPNHLQAFLQTFLFCLRSVLACCNIKLRDILGRLNSIYDPLYKWLTHEGQQWLFNRQPHSFAFTTSHYQSRDSHSINTLAAKTKVTALTVSFVAPIMSP